MRNRLAYRPSSARKLTAEKGGETLYRTNGAHRSAIAAAFIASLMRWICADLTASCATVPTVTSPAFIAGIIPTRSWSSSDACFVGTQSSPDRVMHGEPQRARRSEQANICRRSHEPAAACEIAGSMPALLRAFRRRSDTAAKSLTREALHFVHPATGVLFTGKNAIFSGRRHGVSVKRARK